jgi:hypothetical protein
MSGGEFFAARELKLPARGHRPEAKPKPGSSIFHTWFSDLVPSGYSAYVVNKTQSGVQRIQ